MENKKSHAGKLTLSALILMIFTSVFGFNNIPRAFFLMGYSAIPWYILSAITFFIPYAFMMTELGSAYKDEKGGIYSWMQRSVGSKFAFVGTFMWFTSYVIWMVNVSSSIWIPLSNLIFGEDRTSQWSIIGLTGPKLLGVLGILFITLITYVSSRGLKRIASVASVGGIFVTIANIVLIVGALIVLFGNGFSTAQPLNIKEFMTSPNPAYLSPVSVLSFLVFAIFAYGGLEAVGGLVDETDNPKETFPKGLKIAAIVIGIGYSLGILCIGFFTNWSNILSGTNVSMANVSYIVIKNLGVEIAKVFGFSDSVIVTFGNLFARFIGLAMFLALTGAFFTLIYSPLKQLIEGTPKEVWPSSWTKINDKNMPVRAMWVQWAVVVTIIIVTIFGGKTAEKFLDYLILMGNVAMTIPNLFLAIAFLYFKRNDSIHKPFVIFKKKSTGVIWAVLVIITVGFANIFTIIEPIIVKNDYIATIFQLAGPIVFGTIGYLLYSNYERKYVKNK